MARFTEDVSVVNRLAGRVHEWELLEPVSYYLREEGGETVVVPRGFRTDFASVPRPFWFWVAPWGRHGRAAVLHDFLYQLGSITAPDGSRRRPGKAEADRIFREAMEVLDREILTNHTFWGRLPHPVLAARLAVATPRRWLMWAAVAVFGFFAYRKQRREATAPSLEQRMPVAPAPPPDGPRPRP